MLVFSYFSIEYKQMGLEATKPVFRAFDKGRLKSASSATETSYNIENLLVASSDMLLFNKGITKALIRLRGCSGWSAPLLFVNPEDRFSSRSPKYELVYRIKYKLACCTANIQISQRIYTV